MIHYLSICSGIEAASVAWHPLGWQPVGFAEIEPFPNVVLAHHYPHVPNLGDMTTIDGSNYRGTVDLIVGGTPCQSFSVAGKRGGISDPVEHWPLPLSAWFVMCHRAGLFGKTSPEYFQAEEGQISKHLPPRLSNAGIMSHGECLTLNTSECPSDAVESSLSDILETGDLPQRYYLSRTACAGILRRAEKRQKTLPGLLRVALTAAASDVDQKVPPMDTL